MSWPLIKKEFREVYRTYRIWVVPALFLFFGLSAPVSAKFLPEIAKAQLEAQKIAIDFPQPGILDAYSQYLKNLAQLGVLAVILLSMGLVGEERARGILAQILTKPLSRSAVVLSKFVAHGSFLAGCAFLGALAGYLYTLALFGGGHPVRFLGATLAFTVYLLVVFCVTLLLTVVWRSQILAGGAALLAMLALSLATVASRFLERYSPAGLPSLAEKFVKGNASFSTAAVPLLTSVLTIAVLLALAVLVFRRQEV